MAGKSRRLCAHTLAASLQGLSYRPSTLKAPSESADTVAEVRVSRQGICGLTLVAALSAAFAIAVPAHSATASTKPHALKLLINSKQLPITPFGGPDRYNPITASTVKTVAKWQGSLTGTGYQVQISTTEPTVRIWKTCKTGTSCVVPTTVPIKNGEEMSWTVRMMVKKPHLVKVIGGFMVCLVRHAHPA